jgi:DNA-binding response OmpR family regulator
MPRIAIIEDVAIDSDRLKSLIEQSIEGAEVLQAHTRAQAKELLSNEKLDLVVMDVELGHGPKDRHAGLGLLSEMRNMDWPTIVVSGVPEENLRSLALTLSAYEFIAKPVEDQDFIHKVEHALAWEKSDLGRDLFGAQNWPEGLQADPNRKNKLLWQGKPVWLSMTELSLVQCLIEKPGTVVDKSRLIANLKSTNSAKALATHFSGIRSKFREVDPSFDRIENEPGKGYVWNLAPK